MRNASEAMRDGSDSVRSASEAVSNSADRRCNAPRIDTMNDTAICREDADRIDAINGVAILLRENLGDLRHFDVDTRCGGKPRGLAVGF